MDIEAQHGNTYVVNAEDPAEMARIINLSRLLTKAMGGPLAGIPNLPEGAKVVDLACGPGGWVLDVAFARPDVEIAGVDISKIMIDYAKACLRSQHLTYASFGVMDITQPLEFSDNTFDLVNARYLIGVLRREHWDPFLDEVARILKPGGLLRLTEPTEPVGLTSSKAYQELCRLVSQTFWRVGYGFGVDGYNILTSTFLPRLCRKHGFEQVHHMAHALEFSADCEAWQEMYNNMTVGRSQADLFFGKQEMVTKEEIDRLYSQTYLDWHSPDFCGMWHMISVFGQKPE